MKPTLIKLTYGLSVLTIGSVVYVWQYYSYFDIPIFQYLEISGLITLGLGPILDSSFWYIVTLIVLFTFFDKIFPFGGYSALKQEERETGKKKVSLLEDIMAIIYTIVFLIGGPIYIGYMLLFDIESLYYHLPLIASIVAIFFTNKLIELDIIGNANIDSKAIILAFFIISSMFREARLNWQDVIRCHDFDYVILKGNEPAFLIGKIGAYSFTVPFELKGYRALKTESLANTQIHHFHGESDSLQLMEVRKEIIASAQSRNRDCNY